MVFDIFMEKLIEIINQDLSHWKDAEMEREYRQSWADHYILPLNYIPRFKNVRVVRGVEKMTFIFSTFVIKVYLTSRQSNYMREYEVYQAAVKAGLGEFFPETKKPKTFFLKDGTPVDAYWQRICKGQSVEKNIDTCRKLLIEETFGIWRQWIEIGLFFGGVVAHYYSDEIADRLISFCKEHKVNDIHEYNFVIQPRKKRVQAFDFSGFSW